MRLFYAIEMDEESKSLLMEQQAIFKRMAIKANFTQQENLHLTLRFIGEVDEAHFSVLKVIQDAVCTNSNPFTLTLSLPGVFERGRKSIVWWGVQKNDALFAMQKELETKIQSKGFPGEMKAYNPHITLAREYVTNENLQHILAQFQQIPYSFRVKGISLMESTRIDGKLTYIRRYYTAFQKAKEY